MAINRFMQPWKRDFSTVDYIPNFDAWAKVLEQKEKNYDDLLANADKLSSLVPEAGFALEKDRNEYVDQIKKQTSAIVDQMHSTGDFTSARREISRLASDITSSPRISAYKSDFALKPEVAKIINSQTRETDIFSNQWFDPKTNQIKQTSWDKWNPGYYGTVETKDVNSYFLKQGELLKPMWEKVKRYDDELKIIEAEDGTVKYALTGESGYKEFIDATHLMKYLSPDGQFGEYARELWRNAQGDERAYWDAKYSHLDPSLREQQFYKDLIAANLIRTYSKEQTQELIQPIGVGKQKSPSEEPNKPLQTVVAGKEKIVSKFDKLPQSAGNFLQNFLDTKEALTSFGIDELEKINTEISRKFGTDASTMPYIIRDRSGKFTLNPEIENPEMLYGISLDNLGVTPIDWMANRNEEYKSLQHQMEVQEEILEELGLTDSKTQRVVQDLQNQAYQRAKDDIRQRKGAVRSKDVWGQLSGTARERTPDREPTEEEVNAEFQKLVNSSQHPELKEVEKRLKERRSTPFAIEANAYFPLVITNKDEKAMEGMAQALKGVVTGDLQYAINPSTDEYYKEDQIAILQNASRSVFGGKKAEDIRSNFMYNFKIFQDSEEGKYKLLVTIDNPTTAKELGFKDGIVRYEVPIDDMTMVDSNGNAQGVVQYLGIENNTRLISDLNAIGKQYNEVGAYRSMLSDDNGTKYHINANILKTDANSSTVSYNFKVNFDNGSKFSVNVSSPREGALLKGLVQDWSQVVPSVESEELFMKTLEGLSAQGQLPGFQGWDDNTKRTFAKGVIGKNLTDIRKGTSYSVRSNVETYVDKTLWTGFNRLSDELLSSKGLEMYITSAHDESRLDKKSPINNPNSLHPSGEAIDVRYTEELHNSLLEILKTSELEPGKYYRLPSNKYGPLSVMYEPKGTGKSTGDHFHFARR